MIQEYLQNIKQVVSGAQEKYYDFLIEKGKDYTETIPKEEHPKKYFEPKTKDCFRNSLLNHIGTDSAYVEGFYITDGFGFPFEHAWNIDQNNAVIDTTEAVADFTVLHRFGIVVPADVVEEYLDTEQHETCLKYYFINYIL